MVGAVSAQILGHKVTDERHPLLAANRADGILAFQVGTDWDLFLIHISEPTRPY